MWWKIYTGGHRGAEIKKEIWRIFDTSTGRRVGIVDTKEVHIISDKMANNSMGIRMEKLLVALV